MGYYVSLLRIEDRWKKIKTYGIVLVFVGNVPEYM
jgi:hypothetical protein